MPATPRNTRRNQSSWLQSQLARKPRPVWMLVVTDALIFAVALLTFAYFHHVRPSAQEAIGLKSSRAALAVPAVTNTPEPVQPAAMVEPMATEAPAVEVPEVPVGYFGDKFADKFTGGEVIANENSYQSASLNISFKEYYENQTRFYVADIYVKDIECLQTAFAKDQYGKGYDEWPKEIDARMNSVLTINGDYYGLREDGIVIRNGQLYRKDEMPMRDLCVLFWDGTMETYPSMAIDAEQLIQQGAYQAWNFGPRLLDETGAAMENFNSDVNKTNPRTAIGYYEPGHYCFVVVDGRDEDTDGLTMPQLSMLMKTLGCTRAYNLDGGKTSNLVWNDQVANAPSAGGRKCSDAVVILDMQI